MFFIFAFFLLSNASPARALEPTAIVVNAGPGTRIDLEPEETRRIVFQFLNTGSATWRASGSAPIRFRLKGYGNSFRHASWASDIIPTRLAERSVPPGGTGTFMITLEAPPALGKYHIAPYLILGDVPVAHDTIDLDAYVGYEPASPERQRGEPPSPPAQLAEAPAEAAPTGTPTETGVVAGDSVKPLLDREPTMRIGLFVADTPITITAASTMTIASGSMTETIGAGTLIQITPQGSSASYLLPNGQTQTVSQPVRISAEGGVLEIPSLEQRTAWNASINDNKFRGVLELYYAPNTARSWLVNELPMEQYLKGLAETSQGAPPEYHKALAVATRTYALYHWYAKKKHGGHFDLDATYDQVYRGYGVEQRLTNFGAALDATRGTVAMIGADVVVTPYYSQSDGRTRSWNEVWSGNMSHLQSVPVPQDQGKQLLGHGVGMSSMGAAGMAKEGKTFEEILRYFYQGIELKRAYQ